MTSSHTPLDHGPVRLRLGAAAGVAGLAFAACRVLASSSYDEQRVGPALSFAAAHPALVFLVNACELLAFSLVAFSAITLTGLVRGRGRWLTQVGGWGTAISYLVVAFNGSGVFLAALGSWEDHSAATAAVTRFHHSGQAGLLIGLLVSSALWPLLFGFGLWRARLVGWWYPVVVVIWTALEAVVSTQGVVALVANVLPMAVVVGVWVRLLLDRARVVTLAAAEQPVPVPASA